MRDCNINADGNIQSSVLGPEWPVDTLPESNITNMVKIAFGLDNGPYI